MRNFILLSLILLISISCKKKINVQIIARNKITCDGSNYANVKFDIIQGSGGILDANWETVKKGVLDGEGKASFELKVKRNKDYFYTVNVEHPNTICYPSFYTKYTLVTDVDNPILYIDYLPCGEIDLFINNQNCEGLDDKLYLTVKYQSDDKIYSNQSLSGHIPTSFSGCEYKHQKSFLPIGTYDIIWTSVKTSGVKTTQSATFIINDSQTTNFNVFY
jgi:hypothetical protein